MFKKFENVCEKIINKLNTDVATTIIFGIIINAIFFYFLFN